MTDAPNRPIEDCYWVLPERLMAGEYPGAAKEAETRRKVRLFLEAGFTFFLDLTEEDELNPYHSFLQEEAVSLGRTVIHRRMPIRDVSTPTHDEMEHILDEIDDALADDHQVYFHCWGGVGRTGTVAGCYMVRHGMSGKEALREISRLRAGTPDGWKRSPETDAQRTMVRDWPVEG